MFGFLKNPQTLNKQFLQPTGVTPLQAEGITWDVEDFPDNTTILEKNKGGNGEAEGKTMQRSTSTVTKSLKHNGKWRLLKITSL